MGRLAIAKAETPEGEILVLWKKNLGLVQRIYNYFPKIHRNSFQILNKININSNLYEDEKFTLDLSEVEALIQELCFIKNFLEKKKFLASLPSDEFLNILILNEGFLDYSHLLNNAIESLSEVFLKKGNLTFFL